MRLELEPQYHPLVKGIEAKMCWPPLDLEELKSLEMMCHGCLAAMEPRCHGYLVGSRSLEPRSPIALDLR